MGHPEKDPENSGEFKKDPKLDAILPDDLPPAAAELVGDIDSYQKRMEKEWDSAKVAYEEKINRIMEEFMINQGQPPAHEEKPKPRSSSPRNERLRDLMGELEKEMRRADHASKRFSPFARPSMESMQLGWKPTLNFRLKKYAPWAAGVMMVISAGAFFSSSRVQIDTLPYTHTLGPLVAKDKIYILDWFRKSMYVHKDASGLPILSVEPVANNLATGIAMSEKTMWTLDGLDRKILLHTTTPEHQVTSDVETQGTKPTGLFYDGLDLWSADDAAKRLYRHRGNDIEDIRDSFPMPDITVTGFGFYNNRFWILDGKSRLINVYRLQKPMLQLGSFDLDPFVKGATPTGFTISGKKILIVTENPVSLIRIPLSRLKKSKTETF